MILGAEIGMLVMGIYALIKGKLVLSKTRVLYGARARVLALFALLPIPLSAVCGFAFGIIKTMAGQQVDPLSPALIGMELGNLVLCATMLYAIGWPIAGPPRDAVNG